MREIDHLCEKELFFEAAGRIEVWYKGEARSRASSLYWKGERY